MMGWGYGMGAGGWLLMTGLWLVLIVAAVGLVVWIFPRESRRGSEPEAPARKPQELLDERLARGEIDVETYRVLREELARTVAPRR
jgi:putative membrane protein